MEALKIVIAIIIGIILIIIFLGDNDDDYECY